MVVLSEGNNLSVHGEFDQNTCFRLLAAMHNTVESKGYRDINLDFSECIKALSSEMLVICARCQYYWKDGIDISLELPNNSTIKNLFLNTNWAHFIDFRKYEKSRYRGFTHSPAIKFANGSEQSKAVDKVLDVLLAALSHFGRNEVRYIEWALNEITDNVINHAESKVGGFLQVTNFRQRKEIDISVCDSGLGIPTTLRHTHPEFRTDTEALDAAIKEGVTRDSNFGQGNGLYGSWRIAQISGGSIQIVSNYAQLNSSERNGLHIRTNSIPINGTLVSSRIGYGDTLDLSDALNFAGKSHVPTDYIETHFEEDEDGNVHFIIRDETDGFGSRSAGEPVRRKLINLVKGLVKGQIILDFSDVPLISSSYADEVVGKLFLELGPIEFMSRIKLANLDPLVGNLIDRAVSQRMRQ
jgi:anti-sigma regulatory factor (Ser/Thr protein kinase)